VLQTCLFRGAVAALLLFCLVTGLSYLCAIWLVKAVQQNVITVHMCDSSTVSPPTYVYVKGPGVEV
jgi:hypothetical protein